MMHVPKNLHDYAMAERKTTRKEQTASDSKNQANYHKEKEQLISEYVPTIAPKNLIHTASVSLQEEILSIMMEKPTLQHLISSPPKSFSTVSSPH